MILLLLAALVSPVQADQNEAAPKLYAASVSFNEGRCVYWTGDTAMSASEFRSDLKGRFDTSWGLIIYYDEDVPRRCVESAKRQARRAGFKDVRAELDAVKNFGPPIA